jgi:hypothetical protein
MPKIKLYIATSLDGFIAEPDGGVDWLFTDDDYGYTAFFGSVEALVMGRHTYEQVLGFGEWPYEDRPTYVLTRSAPGGEHPHPKTIAVHGHQGATFRAPYVLRGSVDRLILPGARHVGRRASASHGRSSVTSASIHSTP